MSSQVLHSTQKTALIHACPITKTSTRSSKIHLLPGPHLGWEVGRFKKVQIRHCTEGEEQENDSSEFCLNNEVYHILQLD